jgi:hypothetical protein
MEDEKKMMMHNLYHKTQYMKKLKPVMMSRKEENNLKNEI